LILGLGFGRQSSLNAGDLLLELGRGAKKLLLRLDESPVVER
jgi:hypothetical protein